MGNKHSNAPNSQQEQKQKKTKTPISLFTRGQNGAKSLQPLVQHQLQNAEGSKAQKEENKKDEIAPEIYQRENPGAEMSVSTCGEITGKEIESHEIFKIVKKEKATEFVDNMPCSENEVEIFEHNLYEVITGDENIKESHFWGQQLQTTAAQHMQIEKVKSPKGQLLATTPIYFVDKESPAKEKL